ncbi:MAG TPA: hypothetical protein VME66_07235 [Candidatus Acidoferrales bacterium]|nr:hypothetical protein [Candidatus Acidoferrales bacterium]
MLWLRAVLAIAMILLGIVILVRMLQSIASGVAILPGIVLGGAMIALGAHRLSLIRRARRT